MENELNKASEQQHEISNNVVYAYAQSDQSLC